LATVAVSPKDWLSKLNKANIDIIAIAGFTGMVLVILLIPLPPLVMDIFLIINLSFSILLLMSTVWVKSAMELSSFPSLLLIVTLFRLALNVATTRLILSTGNAGSVVDTFAGFISGNNLVVGFVIFLILVLINFIVITKGSGRVSEVAARFTLDALPGKQMAIDADMNAGNIDEKQAKIRRDALSEEADFYGSMDGASKFVRGDAIAGLVITAINILAGFAIGVFVNGLGAEEAAKKYTLLTIGDGLVTQIPALFISVAAGLLVTKSGKSSNIYVDLNRQLFLSPKPIMAAACLIVLLGLATSFWPASTLVSMALTYYAWTLMKKEEKAIVTQKEAKKETEAKPAEPDKVEGMLKVEQMELEVGYGLIPLVDAKQGGDLLNRINLLRKQIATDMGFIVPPIRIRDNMQLQPNQYVVKIRGNEIAVGEVYPDKLLAMDAGSATGKLDGIQTKEPAFGLPATWVGREMKERANSLGHTVVEPTAVIATHLTELVKNHAAEILTRGEIKHLVDNLDESSKTIVDEVLKDMLTYADLQKVLQNLLMEKVSIKDLETILEVLGDYGRKTKDTEVLTEYVRNALNRSICKDYIEEKNKIYVVTLDPKMEDMITNSVQKMDDGASLLSIDPRVLKNVVKGITTALEKLVSKGHVAPIVLCSPSIRAHVSRFMRSQMPSVVVLSYNEISPGINVEAVTSADLSA
jgi:flagellar biosynthesis protein FlhA